MTKHVVYDICFDEYYEIVKDVDVMGQIVTIRRELSETERRIHEKNMANKPSQANSNAGGIDANLIDGVTVSVANLSYSIGASNATPVTFTKAPTTSMLCITSPAGHKIDLRWNFDVFEVVTDEPLELAAQYFFEEVKNMFAERKSILQEEYDKLEAELNKYKRAMAALENHIPNTVQNAKKTVGL